MVERWTQERGLGTAVENKGDEEPHDIVNSRSSSMAGRIRRPRRKDDSIGKEAEDVVHFRIACCYTCLIKATRLAAV